jgi:hypothetical protein
MNATPIAQFSWFDACLNFLFPVPSENSATSGLPFELSDWLNYKNLKKIH